MGRLLFLTVDYDETSPTPAATFQGIRVRYPDGDWRRYTGTDTDPIKAYLQALHQALAEASTWGAQHPDQWHGIICSSTVDHWVIDTGADGGF